VPAAVDRLLAVLEVGCGAQALRGDGADGRQRVFDAVVQFFQNELLQFVGGLALLGVDTGLRQQRPGIDAGLLKQQAKADIFGLQKLLGNGRAGHRLHSPGGLPFRLASGRCYHGYGTMVRLFPVSDILARNL